VKRHERIGRTAVGAAIWLLLATAAVAAEDTSEAPPKVTHVQAMSGDPVRGLLGTCSCERGGQNELGLARSTDAWPCPCHGTACDSCNDPLKPKCPTEDDYFLVPPRPKLYFAADGGGLRRDPTRDFDFATLSNSQNTVLSTRDFNYDFAAAGRFLVGYTINECFQIEGLYTGAVVAENNAAVRNTSPNALGGVGNLFSPFSNFGNPAAIPGLDYNTFAEIRYSSSFQSAELNVRRKVPMPPERLATSILFGVRYAGLPEEFNYQTQSFVPLPGGSSNTVHVSTDNQMVGPQIGALFEMYVDNRWWINFEMKAALLNNHARQTTTYTNTNVLGTTTFVGTASDDHTAFLGDLNLTFIYRWTPNCSTRLGYQAVFLENMALAPNNFEPNVAILVNGPAQLHHGAGTIYHGPFAGVTFGW
jgi:hypothetical protein